MPKITRRGGAREQQAPPEVTGLLAPEVNSSAGGAGNTDPIYNLDVATVLQESQNVDMFYLCRAYSEENRPGFHPNEDRFYCEEHVKSRDSDLIDMFIVGVLDGHDGAAAADKVGALLEFSMERLQRTR